MAEKIECFSQLTVWRSSLNLCFQRISPKFFPNIPIRLNIRNGVRCCKQNQLNSNSPINNSQTNHFDSHFFLILSLLHPLFPFLCVSFFALLPLLFREFATFPLNASNFKRENSGCTCWFVSLFFSNLWKVREKWIKMILLSFTLWICRCFIRKISVQKWRKSVLLHWMTAGVQMQRSEDNRRERHQQQQQKHQQYKKMHTINWCCCLFLSFWVECGWCLVTRKFENLATQIYLYAFFRIEKWPTLNHKRNYLNHQICTQYSTQYRFRDAHLIL